MRATRSVGVWRTAPIPPSGLATKHPKIFVGPDDFRLKRIGRPLEITFADLIDPTS
jgi:hypothetical protein